MVMTDRTVRNFRVLRDMTVKVPGVGRFTVHCIYILRN
jgi:hypothetical protein